MVRYSSKEEAAKAQKSLHMYVSTLFVLCYEATFMSELLLLRNKMSNFSCFKIHGTNWYSTQELENLSDKISDVRKD